MEYLFSRRWMRYATAIFMVLALASDVRTQKCTVFSKPGDLIIGGIMPFRYSNLGWCQSDYGISYWGVRMSEAFIWAIDQINARDDILPNITLGYEIRDDCRSEEVALWTAMSYFVDTCEKEPIHQKSNLVGIVGGSWSSTAVWMAKVVNLFKVPLIAFTATSDELSDTVRFPYFFRTIPPDRFQVGAIMEILLRFDWRYIALIYSTDTYGLHGGRQIRSAADKNGICIALLASIQPYAPKYEVDEVVGKLKTFSKVKVVVIFSLGTVAYTVLETAQSMGFEGRNITWIGSDGWGGSSIYKRRGLGELTIGAIFTRILDHESDRFTRYFSGIDPDDYPGISPWFKEYWQKYKEDTNCTSIEQCSLEVYVTTNGVGIRGVKALAYGLDAMLRDSCRRGECYSPHNFTGSELRQYLYNVSFNSSDGLFIFDEFGDTPGKYKFMNLQRNGMTYSIDQIGSWDPRKEDHSRLDLNVNQMQFAGHSKQPRPSLCRDECVPGYIIIPLEEKCCFGCQVCPENAIVINGSICQECAITHWPDVSSFAACEEIIPTPVLWREPVIIAVLSLASVGILCILLVSTGMYVYRNHPLVKATSRELSAVNVFGISLAFFDVFAFVVHPSIVACVIAESLLSLFFTVTIVPTLLKVVRIYRIFRAGTKSVQRPKFVGIRDQLIMTILLIGIQVLYLCLLLIYSFRMLLYEGI